MSGKFDLHAHTTASDGVLSPEGLVELALDRGIDVLGITDHDSTDGVGPALVRAAGTSLEVWPGVEISTDVPQGEVHMLGYFVDPGHPQFQEILGRLRDSRLWRAEQMVAKLGALGMPVSFERVREIAGAGSVGRPHVAQALLEQGYVPTIKEAFDLYLHRHGPAYVERFKLTPPEAVRLIREAGGMPVLAHPMYISPGDGSVFDLPHFVRELTDAGLVGIECYYGDYAPEVVRGLLKIAREFDLIPTGGTDFHGGSVTSIDLGEREIPPDTIEQMRAWRTTHT